MFSEFLDENNKFTIKDGTLEATYDITGENTGTMPGDLGNSNNFNSYVQFS